LVSTVYRREKKNNRTKHITCFWHRFRHLALMKTLRRGWKLREITNFELLCFEIFSVKKNNIFKTRLTQDNRFRQDSSNSNAVLTHSIPSLFQLSIELHSVNSFALQSVVAQSVDLYEWRFGLIERKFRVLQADGQMCLQRRNHYQNLAPQSHILHRARSKRSATA
jgi:hypothetical protein